jgi:hypothetical protein
MPFPRLNFYGIIENPLEFTPFIEDNFEGGGGNLPSNLFLLLNGNSFGLLGGGSLELLG